MSGFTAHPVRIYLCEFIMDYFYDLWLGYTICYYNISFCVTVVIEGKKNFELFTF